MTEVYDETVSIRMRGVDDPVGLPYTVHPLELVDREVLVELREGPPGGPGPQGAPAWPWLWQGDIATPAALTALNLTTADARKAWRVVSANAIYFWTGMDMIAFGAAFQTPGPQGAPAAPTGSAVAGAVGSSAAAALTGTAPSQALEVTMPRGATGATGDPGEAGKISDAADVGDLAAARQGSVLAWAATPGEWRPIPAPRLGGPWAVASSQFVGGSNISATTKTIATMTIPAQPIAWRPIVLSGNITVQVHVSAFNDTHVEIEIRLGSPEGEIIGYGYATGVANRFEVQLYPRWQHAVTPDSDLGIVGPSETAVVYVIARKIGDRNYSIVTTGAQLVVAAQPLMEQP
ncbi:hypothetical protein ACIBG0_40180 [Nocardia sp. NPDC050630]|uniref:hypothetical protein n=1 Tax=Nocardia sp. NPDC050630 TaxID=3364321 RepID=UPI003798D758